MTFNSISTVPHNADHDREADRLDASAAGPVGSNARPWLDRLSAHMKSLSQGDIFGSMEKLLVELTNERHSCPASEWNAVCRTLQDHALLRFVHRAPFTRRAYEKPRGYPGDAVTLDFIYGIETLPADADDVVHQLYAWEYQTPSCRSVRERKALLAKRIDSVCEAVDGARVVSLACGHLREARESDAVLSRRFEQFIGVDQDRQSLEVVSRQLSPYGVEALHGNVRSILARKLVFSDLDLVYAAGLYDYLSDALATELSKRLFDMLRPGGRLLLANFNPSLRDIGYLEAFMDWRLVYRNDEAMFRLIGSIPESSLRDVTISTDRFGNITFLEIVRA